MGQRKSIFLPAALMLLVSFFISPVFAARTVLSPAARRATTAFVASSLADSSIGLAGDIANYYEKEKVASSCKVASSLCDTVRSFNDPRLTGMGRFLMVSGGLARAAAHSSPLFRDKSNKKTKTKKRHRRRRRRRHGRHRRRKKEQKSDPALDNLLVRGGLRAFSFISSCVAARNYVRSLQSDDLSDDKKYELWRYLSSCSRLGADILDEKDNTLVRSIALSLPLLAETYTLMSNKGGDDAYTGGFAAAHRDRLREDLWNRDKDDIFGEDKEDDGEKNGIIKKAIDIVSWPVKTVASWKHKFDRNVLNKKSKHHVDEMKCLICLNKKSASKFIGICRGCHCHTVCKRCMNRWPLFELKAGTRFPGPEGMYVGRNEGGKVPARTLLKFENATKRKQPWWEWVRIRTSSGKTNDYFAHKGKGRSKTWWRYDHKAANGRHAPEHWRLVKPLQCPKCSRPISKKLWPKEFQKNIKRI